MHKPRLLRLLFLPPFLHIQRMEEITLILYSQITHVNNFVKQFALLAALIQSSRAIAYLSNILFTPEKEDRIEL